MRKSSIFMFDDRGKFCVYQCHWWRKLKLIKFVWYSLSLIKPNFLMESRSLTCWLDEEKRNELVERRIKYLSTSNSGFSVQYLCKNSIHFIIKNEYICIHYSSQVTLRGFFKKVPISTSRWQHWPTKDGWCVFLHIDVCFSR